MAARDSLNDRIIMQTKQAFIPFQERLIVALDVSTLEEAKKLVLHLGESVHFYKIGMELFMATGLTLIDWLAAQNKKIFIDLKFFDIPETVAGAVRVLSKTGVSLTTIHGNDLMMKAAVSEKGDDLGVLAVTALTSLDDGDLKDLGFQCDIKSLVLSRAKRALAAGVDGIVSSGLEVRSIREECDQSLILVTPGIRPIENKRIDDQKRVISVTDALALGSDYLVVGRPIRQAAEPRAIAEKMQSDIRAYFMSQPAS